MHSFFASAHLLWEWSCWIIPPEAAWAPTQALRGANGVCSCGMWTCRPEYEDTAQEYDGQCDGLSRMHKKLPPPYSTRFKPTDMYFFCVYQP
mmetsp:Transcript_63001/g.121394  ORF Transcript_63001/g.121394 Transcript_63001/m.121394 type:complete len:92 (-) Transcript_63001:135-410(-)